MTMKTFTSRLGLTLAACLIGGAAMAYPAQVSRDLNLRSGPGTNYQVVATMPGGAVVDVEGCRGSWCRVEYRGRQGWASGNFLGEVRQSRGPVYRDPPPVYGYSQRVRPAPGITLEFGFGGEPRYYDDRPHRPRGHVVRRDRNNDGRADVVRRTRPDGATVVRRDRDGDGYFETRRIVRPDGTVVVRRDTNGDGNFDDVVRRRD